MKKKRAVILDRDGTLNEDKGYVHKIEDFKLLFGVVEGLKLLQEKYLLFIITNQAGIGRGYYTVKDFHKFNNYILESLKNQGIKIEKTYFCPHTDKDGCDCRKPKTKFIDIIVKDYEIDLKNSWVIGDHPSDIELGINAGTRTIFLFTGHGSSHADELRKKKIKPTFMAQDFLTAAKIIDEHTANK